MPRFVIFFVIAIACFARAGFSVTYVVAQDHPKAGDDGPGTEEQPWKSLAKAASSVTAGDTVIVHAGTYRERVLVKSNGTAEMPILFQAAPGDWVTVTGADRIRKWTKADPERPIYSVEWPYKFNAWNKAMTHPNDQRHAVIGRAEQVWIDGYLARQVLTREQLAPGSFFADVENKTLYAWDSGNADLNQVTVEAATRSEIWRSEGAYVNLRGFRFRYAANAAQAGAVVLAGKHDRMEDCVVEATNGEGATFTGEDQIVRRCEFRDHGEFGFTAGHAHRLLFTDCLVENNNTKNFSRGWAAGGTKVVLCRDVVIEKSRFLRNRGVGIWFDIGNENCSVQNCLVADNEDAGIFYEISYGLQAHDNVLIGNGFANTKGAWGAQAAICLSSSPGCVIERNLMVANREGFNFREQTRTTVKIDEKGEHPIWNHDEMIRCNLIALNRDAQVAGWFAIDDKRHWLVHTAEKPSGAEAKAPQGDLAGDYVAKNQNGQPRGLTLEKLNLRFEKNVYFAAPGRRLIQWGPTWTEHQWYDSVEAFQAALGIDEGGKITEPKFTDLLSRDLTLPPDAEAAVKACYPRGVIPSAGVGRN